MLLAKQFHQLHVFPRALGRAARSMVKLDFMEGSAPKHPYFHQKLTSSHTNANPIHFTITNKCRLKCNKYIGFI